MEQSSGCNENLTSHPSLGKVLQCNAGGRYVKTYRVDGHTVHVRLYDRAGGGDGDGVEVLVPTTEHDSRHPFCQYQHIFLLDASAIDSDKGDQPETY